MRTAEELTDKLSEERIWRVKEISTVSNLASRSRMSPVETDFYCRAGSALFYAHWEGFVKRAATHYLKYISYQRISLDEMADFVMCLYMRQNLGEANSSSPAQIIKVTQQLQDSARYNPKLNWKNVIDTQSNLSSNVLKKIMLQLGFDYSFYATRAAIIDGKIVKHRNAVAHGEKGEVDLAILQEIGFEVISLITLFKDLIENSVTLKSYRKI